ncbi:MAG: hypothetical protein B7Z37_19575 [Verrucomicrobia bacterium 12-59-8]|nr:MAG: hypothetical protein B7Z37_19575 [Verrucomicrobia bacterium 12-59-8]
MRSASLLFLSFIIAPLALADTRVFVSLAGTLLEAEITAVSGDNVTLKRVNDQQSLVVSRKTLCKEDGAYIAGWVAQHPDQATAPATAAESTAAPAQKYRLACQTLPAKSNRGPADSDHRVFEYTYSFNLSNREVTRDLEDARGLVLTLGKNAAESSGDLVVLQKEEFDVTIRAQSKMVHVTQPVRLTYSQDPDLPYGVKSYGYILIIRDAASNVLHVEASPDASAKFIKEILAITQVPCMVDREFRPKTRSDVPLGYISF